MNNTKKITYTALLLALGIAFQHFNAYIPAPFGQYISGAFVNAILIIAAVRVGLFSGLAIAIITPIFAFILGGGVLRIVPQLIPVIMTGNMIIVICVWLIMRGTTDRPYRFVLGLGAGAIAKSAFLWAAVSLFIVPVFGSALNPMQTIMLISTFSYNQLITAALGGVLAFAILPALRKMQ